MGPGEITDSAIGIQGAARITVTDLNIHDNEVGILTYLSSVRGKVIATNVTVANSVDDSQNGGPGVGIQANTVIANGVTVTGATFDGFYVRNITGQNVTASNNGLAHPTGGIGFGIVSVKVRLTNLTATGNSGNGVIGKHIALRDSTVTGNTGQPTNDIDIFAERRPHLHNTTCGKSNGWGVCANDGSSPSGAFLDAAR